MFAETGDVDAVARFGRARVGEDHAGGDVLRSRLERQPTCVAVLREGDGSIAAASILYALTDEATKAVLSSHVINGAGLMLEDLADDDAGSLYAGSLAARNGLAIAGLGLLVWHLGSLLQNHASASWLFGRGATPAGAGLLDRLGFAALPEPSEIRALRLDPALVSELGDAALSPNAVAPAWRALVRHRGDRTGRHNHL